VAGRQTGPLGFLNTINVIAPYRYHGTWVFDDPRVGLVREPFISDADTLIDSAVVNILGADRGFFLIFSGQPFPGHVIRLIWRRSDTDGNWYYSESLDHEAWLCPALLKYFDDVPKTLYLQCKAKPQDAKHPSDWTVKEQQRIADGHCDSPEPALLAGSRGADAQFSRSQPEHVVPDPYVSHLHRFGAPAWVRGATVLMLFIIVIGNLVLATIGLLGGSRPRGYLFLFLAWTMGITGLVMLARLWRAMVLQREPPPSEPTT
jgi:hypothetical protein